MDNTVNFTLKDLEVIGELGTQIGVWCRTARQAYDEGDLNTYTNLSKNINAYMHKLCIKHYVLVSTQTGR